VGKALKSTYRFGEGGTRVFKKTEDSEWSRFSRALSGQSKAGSEEEIAKEEPLVEEQAPMPRENVSREPVAREGVVRESAPREATQQIAVPAPAAPVRQTSAPAAQPSYMRHSGLHDDETETIIGSQTTFDGTLKCESGLRIKGCAQGEILSAKSVIIEETARVNANVRAANATVAGQLEGSIVCEGRLEILATGRVTGELSAGVLVIQEGAFFEGHLKMKDRPAEKPAEAPAPAPSRRLSSSEPVVN
jgi:cytoskeletal protein CcmA (bactofilin family)